MTQRDAAMQNFIDAMQAAVAERAAEAPEAAALADRIFSALATPAEAANGGGTRLPVCDASLDDAYANARSGPAPIPDLADAFAAIESRLKWYRRPGSEAVGGPFHDNHANAEIVSANGLERRDDVRIGVSLVAPEIDYPRHRHPPEELYVVLSPGEWMNCDRPMQAKQSGDIVHNPPGVWHAMRSGEVPLLAIWCLWTAPETQA